jgi:phage-related protein
VYLYKFYRTESGRTPVREFIERQPGSVSIKLREHIRRLCSGFPDQVLVDAKHLRGGLWEIRVKVDKKEYRIIYCLVASEIIFLHSFIKKKRRSGHEIETAEQRYKNYIQRFKG